MKTNNLHKLLEEASQKEENIPLLQGHENRFEAKLKQVNIKPKKKKFPIQLAIAASFTVLLGLGLFYTISQLDTKNTPTSKPQTAPISKEDKQQQIEEILENQNFKPNYLDSSKEHYATIEKQKVSLINKAKANKPIIDDGMDELKKLEKEYQKLEQDLLVSGNEKVIEAMNKNLKLREKILEKTQRNIERASAFSNEIQQ